MKYLLLHIITLCSCVLLFGQEPAIHVDSTLDLDGSGMIDSLRINGDSIRSFLDTLEADTLTTVVVYPLSSDAIDQQIDYGSRDSMVMDNLKREAYLYGGAYVVYGQMKLEADFIKLDLNNNIASAEGMIDTSGQMVGKPVFIDGTEEFKADRLKYNFDTRRGLVYDVRTQEGDLEVLTSVTKFHGKNPSDSTSSHKIYGKDGLFTTCDHDVPHFGIRSKKQKIIAGKLAVVGPSNLEIGGVPTPLYLPFGFFPLKQGKRSGLIFPNNYEYSDLWGFGLANVGYYFPINDFMDFTLLTDIYLRGSYRIDGDFRYRKRYKYSGSLFLGYSDFRQEQVTGDAGAQRIALASDKSFSLRVSHRQDAKAHPYRTIGGTINIETNQYQNLNNNSASSVLNNSLNSNFSLTQRIPNSPFTLSMAMRHTQNTQTRDVSITLPDLDIRMNQINPFKRKNRIGPEKWYENVVLEYSGTSEYRIQAKDSTLFERETFEDARFGVQHNASTSVNFNVLKHFQLSPRINYSETWYTKSTNSRFEDGLDISLDTIFNPVDSTDFTVIMDTLALGETVSERLSGFRTLREYDASLTLFTKIYGTANFKKGWLRGIRHTIKPSISMRYTPDYTRESLDYFGEYIEKNVDGTQDTIMFDRFADEIFRGASSAGEQFSLNYSLQNVLEAKTYRRRDSSLNKMQLLDNFNVSGSYNFAADSLKWSRINVSTNVRLMKGLTIIKVSGALDPYALNEDGRRINRFEHDVSGKLLRLDNMSVSLNTGASVRQIRGLFGKDKEQSGQSLWSFIDDLRVTYQYTLRSDRREDNSLRFTPSTNSVALRGQIQMSPKWVMSIGNLDYNFVRKTTSYPDFTLARDLHCWNMGVSWQPERSTYSFFIKVKPGSLEFINLPYNRNRADGFQNR